MNTDSIGPPILSKLPSLGVQSEDNHQIDRDKELYVEAQKGGFGL